MSWYWAVLATFGVFGFWPLFVVVGDGIDKLFQQRMDATLWRSLPAWTPTEVES